MKTKYIFKIVFAVVFVFLATISCSDDLLDVRNLNDPDKDSTLNDPAGFTGLANGMLDAYQKVAAGTMFMFDLRSDDCRSANGDGNFGNVEAYRITSDYGEGSNYWTNNYKVIRTANTILDNQDRITVNNKNQIIGEAYFMRALSHFNLARAFGDVPYVDTEINATDFVNYPRLPLDLVYRNIINDFSNAISNLDGFTAKRNRPTVGAAKAFLAKAYLTSPIPDYSAARILLDELADPNNPYRYALEPNFATVFSSESELNEEIIFAISFSPNSPPSTTSDARDDLGVQIQGDSQRWSLDMTQAGRAQGLNLATDELLAVFTVDTEPVRFPATFLASSLGTSKVENNKFQPDGGEFSGRDWIEMRYADVLLLHAEAIIGDQLNTSEAAALISFNLVRERAGVPTLPSGSVLTKQQVLDERRIELVFENHRFFDLIRFGAAVPVLTEFSDNNEYNFSATDLLLPIPQRERDATDNFYPQNPGY